MSKIINSQEQGNYIDVNLIGTNKKSKSLNKRNTDSNISQAGFVEDDFKESHKKSKKI